MKQTNLSEEEKKQWIRHIDCQRVPIFYDVLKAVQPKGTVVEIGAGTSWLSAHLSHMSNIREITVIDEDCARLELARSFFLPHYRASTDKINIVCCDFHAIPKANHVVDYVVVDAALHHTDKPVALLREVARVLTREGKLIALREPILPRLPFLQLWKRLRFGFVERLRGDVEHTYTQDEWRRIFSQAGFAVTFYPTFAKKTVKGMIVRSIGKWANNWLYGWYYIVAEKKN